MKLKDYVLIFFIATSFLQTGFLINEYLGWRMALKPAEVAIN